jgi:MEDS: MEthanogen/methylotroph, DcmR Sensory domain
MVNKEKLVDANLESIIQLLCECQYGEHNIVIYPNLDSFREIYARLTKARINNCNDKVILLPHYETAKSVEQALMEMDLRAKDEVGRGSLEVIDSYHAFFDPEQTFLQVVSAALNDAVRAGKTGAVVIADMGSFYHRQAIDNLIAHECKIPSKQAGVNSTIFCCYNHKDFQNLTKLQEEKLCENHYRNLFVRARDR